MTPGQTSSSTGRRDAILKGWETRRRTGNMPGHRGDFGDRVAKRVYHDAMTGCWLFYGRLAPFNYPLTDIQGRRVLAHRAAWEFYRGPIPEGMFVCHKCDTPGCVNPDHLFVGTPAENVRDMDRKGRSRRVTPKSPTRLTPSAVAQVLSDYASGTSSSVIAERLGVSRATVVAVLRGESWKAVGGDRPREGATSASPRNRRTGYKRRVSK